MPSTRRGISSHGAKSWPTEAHRNKTTTAHSTAHSVHHTTAHHKTQPAHTRLWRLSTLSRREVRAGSAESQGKESWIELCLCLRFGLPKGQSLLEKYSCAIWRHLPVQGRCPLGHDVMCPFGVVSCAPSV
jgi:hypothetical protein